MSNCKIGTRKASGTGAASIRWSFFAGFDEAHHSTDQAAIQGLIDELCDQIDLS